MPYASSSDNRAYCCTELTVSFLAMAETIASTRVELAWVVGLHTKTPCPKKLSPISILTRSTGTVHTSTKAWLIRVVTRIQIRDPDRHQNLIICSLAHCQPSLKISCKSVPKFLRKVHNRQTNKQTTNNDYISYIITSLQCNKLIPMPSFLNVN